MQWMIWLLACSRHTCDDNNEEYKNNSTVQWRI
jgi:hypothetical protein